LKKKVIKLDSIKEYSTLYICLAVLSTVTLFIVELMWNGNYRYLHADPYDTGMDFLNSIVYTTGGKPYFQYGTIYPPLANLFFYILNGMVPSGISAKWPKTGDDILKLRGSILDLRIYQNTVFAWLLYSVIIAVLIFSVVTSYEKNRLKGILLGIAILLSHGVLYALERGNIILISLFFLLIFTKYFDSDNKVLREAALLALVISADLKLYPAVFGLLLLGNKQYREALRAIIYGIMGFILPLFAFEGLGAFKKYFTLLFSYNNNTNLKDFYSFGFSSLSKSITWKISSFLHLDYETIYRTMGQEMHIIKAVLAVGLVICFLMAKEKYQKLYIAFLLCILFQDAKEYTFVFSIPALLELMYGNEPKAEQQTNKWLIFILLCVINLCIPLYGLGHHNWFLIMEQGCIAVSIAVAAGLGMVWGLKSLYYRVLLVISHRSAI